MTSIEGMPHVTTEPYVTTVLDLARRLGYPRIDIAGETIADNEGSWAAWVAGASRAQLVTALGVLTARAHREGKT